MQCSKCNTENRAGATFCDACGAALEYKCDQCDAQVKPHAKFCDACGASLSSGSNGAPDPESISLQTELPPVASLELVTDEAPVPEVATADDESPLPERQALPSDSDVPPVDVPDSFGGGRYKVIAFVGEGAKKLVYQARDSRLDRDVAISLIKSKGMTAHDLARLKREAQAMAWLGDHPNVVTIYDLGEEDGQIFIVSQYMEGGDVATLLKSEPGGRLAPERALEVTSQVATALEHAHEKGIIHRDIKPENVWLTSDGTAKLGDFGMAMVSTRTRITAAGMMIGTANYMAPEIVLGKSREADARCDIYSLGAMLYEMLTGLPPFEGDMNEVINGHLNLVPPTPSLRAPGISPEIDSLVLWMLAKAPNDRPRSAQMLQQSIAAIRAGNTSLGPATVAAAIEDSPLATEQVMEEPISPSRATAVMTLPAVPTKPPDAVAAEVEEPAPIQLEPEPALEESPAAAALVNAIVGRDTELDDLGWVLDETLAGRGRFVRISGAQGIGRSRLAAEIASRASEKGARVFQITCRESDRPGPFHYWLPLIGSLVGEYEVSKLRTDLGDEAPALAKLLSGDPLGKEKLLEAGSNAVLDTDPDPEALVPGLTRMVRRLAASTPFVAVVDDAEWADGASLRLLEELAHGASIISMLLIVTAEDDPASARSRGELDRLESVEARKTLGLKPLEATHTSLLSASVFGFAPRQPLAAAIASKTGGNPLAVLAAARTLMAEGALEGTALAEEWNQRVPSSLDESVARQLAVFTDDARDVVNEAAIIGEEFNLMLLAALTNTGEADLRELLQAPVFAGLILPGDGTFSFAHKLLRESVLASPRDASDDADAPALARWRSALLGATKIAMAGSLDEAEEIAEQAHRLGSAAGAGEAADQIFGVQIYGIRKLQARLADVEVALKAIAAGISEDAKWRAAMVSVHIECGRPIEAGEELAALAAGDFAAIPDDANRLAVLCSLAQAAVQLRDGERCQQLLDLLTPFAGRVALLDGGAHCEGAVDRALGLLADALSRDDDAVRSLEAAAALNDSLGASVLAANTRRELAAALIHRDNPGDTERASTLLREAESMFSAMGLEDSALQVAALAAATEAEPLASELELADLLASRDAGIESLVAGMAQESPDLSGDAAGGEAVTLVMLAGPCGSELESAAKLGRLVCANPQAILLAYASAMDAIGEASLLVGFGHAEAGDSGRCAAVHSVSTDSAAGDLLIQQVKLIASIAQSCGAGEVIASAAAHELGRDARESIEERFVDLKGFPGSHRVFVTKQ